MSTGLPPSSGLGREEKRSEVPFDRTGTASVAPVRRRRSLEVADGYNLVPVPDSDSEGAGSAAQDGVWAVVERLKGWDDAAPTDPDDGGGEELAWQLARIFESTN